MSLSTTTIVEERDDMAASAIYGNETCYPTDDMLSQYQPFIDLLDHHENYQSADVGSYSGYYQRQKQFTAVRDVHIRQNKSRNVEKKLGIGINRLTPVDLAAIQGFQKEARDMMLCYRRQLDAQMDSTPEYFPEVPAGWSGNAKQSDRVVISAECIENRRDALSTTVQSMTIEARPFQRQDATYLTEAEREERRLEQEKIHLKEVKEGKTDAKGKKPSTQALPKDPSVPPLPAIPARRIPEVPTPLIRDTSSFAPTPQSLIVQRMENLKRFRNAVNVIVFWNRAQQGLRRIQAAYANFLPLYMQRHRQDMEANAVCSPTSQYWRLATLIFERKCKANAIRTFDELLSLYASSANTNTSMPSFDDFLFFLPPPSVDIEGVSSSKSALLCPDQAETHIRMSRSIPELLFYRFGARVGCNPTLQIDRDAIRAEQLSVMAALI